MSSIQEPDDMRDEWFTYMTIMDWFCLIWRGRGKEVNLGREGEKRERVEGEGKAIVPHVSHTEKNLLSVKSTLGLAEVNPAMECPQ